MEANKIFLIVDSHLAHKSEKVKTWVEEYKDRIALHFLPPYSPELNPTELTWNTMEKRWAR